MNFILESFPESLFPPKNKEEYLKRILLGTVVAQNSTVIFCGIARNVGPYLPNTYARLNRMGSMFKDYQIVVVENDSEDSTVNQLKYWGKTALLTRSFGWPKLEGKERTEKLAEARNVYLDYISLHQADYVVVVDFDLMGGWSYEGLMHSLSFDFDCISSNGLLYREKDAIYYDSFALRLDGVETEGEKNQFLKERGSDLVPVKSGFGGLAIYSWEVFLESRYSGEECEHVSFHRKLIERGYTKHYLNPSMIGIYSPTLYYIPGT